MTDNITLQVYLICKGPFAKVEQALGIDTWSQPVHDIFIGMASLLCTRELSKLTQSVSIDSSHFLG